MSAEVVRAGDAVAGVLDDGTPCYAPVGEVVVDGSLVICHLCGRGLRSVVAHLPSHGWTKEQYCEAFGLERGQSLEGPATRKLRAAALTARLVFDPAMGRAIPEQRRRKSVQALAAIPRTVVAQANRDRADQHLAEVAAGVARGHGYPDIGAYVLARTRAGASLAVISREAGLHKDWLSRHLRYVDPAADDAVRRLSARRQDARWLPAVRGLGFADVASYLTERHINQHRTINAIAAEVGVSYQAVRFALRRHGLRITGHTAKRHAARQRAADVAARLGHATIAGYISQRRAEGWTWNAMAAESGQPQTWLRRHAAS